MRSCSPQPGNRKAVDGCWRSVNAVGLVRSLLTQKAVLARAADGLLDADEQARVLAPARAIADDWTAADLPLLDEAEALVKGGAAAVRPRRGRRSAGPFTDAAADAGPPRARGTR